MKYTFNSTKLAEEDLSHEFDKLQDAILGIAGELHMGYQAFDDAVSDGVISEDGQELEDDYDDRSDEEIATDIYDDLTVELEDEEVDTLAIQAAIEATEALSEENINDTSPLLGKLIDAAIDLSSSVDVNIPSIARKVSALGAAIKEYGFNSIQGIPVTLEEGVWDHKNEVIKYLKDHAETLTSDFETTMKDITKMLMPDFEEEGEAASTKQTKEAERGFRAELATYVQVLKEDAKTPEEAITDLASIFKRSTGEPARDKDVKRLFDNPTAKEAEKVLKDFAVDGTKLNVKFKKVTDPMLRFLKNISRGLIELEAVTTATMGDYIPDVKLSGPARKRLRPKMISIEEITDIVSKTILEEAVRMNEAGKLTEELRKIYNKALSTKGKLFLINLRK